MFARDYETKGMLLIWLGEYTGAVNATKENFTIAAEDMAENKNFQKQFKPQGGVYCLVPGQLDTPF